MAKHVAVAGEGVSLWALDPYTALPTWNRVGTIAPAAPISLVRLSPSALVLATVASNSITVILSHILPKGPKNENRLRFRSRATHSVRLRSISWRASDNLADSGPVLFTQTIDGVFRIWGCVIDEPNFFSLWTSLDVHASLPKQIPLATCYWRTRPMEGQDPARGGTEDDFVTVFSDGSVHLSTVSNFDCRPPTCVSQSSRVLQQSVFQPTQLANFRFPHLLPSRSDPSSFHFVGRSSRGTLVHSRATLPASGLVASAKPAFHDGPTLPPVSLVGSISQLVPTARGEAVLVLGSGGRVQSWEMGDDEVITESFVAEAGIPADAKVATWHDGRMIAAAFDSTLSIFKFRHSGRLRLVTSCPAPAPTSDVLAFFIARSSEESLSTSIFAVSSAPAPSSAAPLVHCWVYNHATKALDADGPHELHGAGPLVCAVGVPPAQEDGCAKEEIALMTLDLDGTLVRWTANLTELADGWTRDGEVKTGSRGVQEVAVNAEGTSAIVSVDEEGKTKLSIWDPKASEFSSGEQFSQDLESPIVKLAWSVTGDTLAWASEEQVSLMCPQRFDDLSGAPSWAVYASVRIDDVLPAPIASFCWLETGLALAAADHVFFFSSKLDTGEDAHVLAAGRCAPLPLHHPQLLFQALLQGHFNVVLKVLVGLAAELTADGHLTPVPMRNKVETLTLDAFLRNPSLSTKTHEAHNDIFATLTTSDAIKPSGLTPRLTEDDMSRLLAALSKRSLRGLNKLEHEHLAVLARTVYQTQTRTGSIDENGLRYLVSMRSFYLYSDSPSAPAASVRLNGPLALRLKYRDLLWAFHSESQDLLLEEGTKAAGGKLTWAAARTLGVAVWLKSHDALIRAVESIGRTEFMKPGAEDRDPISAMLFYLALKKPHIVTTFWRQASGHPEQRQLLKFLSNDFEEARWRSAANKNAFALMSKQRFLFAAAFFLLGGSLKDACNVCARQLDDVQLAILLARTYEGGNDGPVLRTILEETVIPHAFANGFRWLGSWAFWMLNRRDLAVQIIVTPLSRLASRLPYRLPAVSSPKREDPALVFLFAQLRSWSLQTVKGCHVLALNLLRTWHFLPPTPASTAASTTAPRRPNPLHHRRASLLLSSTKLDLPLPASNLPSRVASPAPPQQQQEDDAAERERQKKQYREVINTVKVEAKAPAEFSLDAFGF
ncbi:hypothetical protein Rhopal_002484-T1 [Rhodotorula paludigena]|uniref:RAVE complex protein Rav1 C-terminal domain-containing protein n=1 Tax=Rhodotorula paludigena TaxID=86838 RepID=A0AAV5GKC7_9BASI|nr:hypothetical protein Rhopal_002484-T1 [Rhodotorula paludigena]